MFKFLWPLALCGALGCSSASAPAGVPVRLTAYNAAPGQTDGDPEYSACGRTRSGQVALSPDLKRRWPCGTRLRVFRPDTGRWHTYVVWDTTSARKRHQVDILMPTRRAALNFGVQRGRALPE